MYNWTLEKLRNDNELEKATCNGDCYLLYQYNSDNTEHLRGYALYKLGNNETYTYVMIVQDDALPILITEEEALNFLNDPEMAKTFAYNTWFDRYR